MEFATVDQAGKSVFLTLVGALDNACDGGPSVSVASSTPRSGGTRSEALALEAAGFWVVPIEPGGKRPSGKEWGLVRNGPREIERLLSRTPNANLGIALGPGRGPNGAWLVDLECDGEGAEESLIQLLGSDRILTMAWLSRRGKHLAFTVDGERLVELLTRCGALEAKGHQRGVYKLSTLPGLEIRVGGFKEDGTVRQLQSLVPPSVTDGFTRTWIHGPEALAELPEAAYTALERLAERKVERAAGGASDSAPVGLTTVAQDWRSLGIDRAIAYLKTVDPAISGKRGHDTLLRAACYLVRLGIDDPETVFRLLRDHYNPRCQPPWSEAELRHKAEEACRIETRRDLRDSGSMPTPRISNRGSSNSKASPIDDEGAYASLTLDSYGPLLSDTRCEDTEWIVENRLAVGKMHLRIGPGGVGKSTVAYTIAAGLTVGGSYLGIAPFKRSGRVAVLAAEDGTADAIKPRLVAAGGDPTQVRVLRTEAVTEDKTRRKVVIPAVFSDLNYWKRFFELWQPTLLIIDPIQAVLGPGVNDHRNSDVRAVLNPFVQLIRDYGVAFEGITHTPKQIQSRNPAEAAISSVAYPNLSRVVHVHWRDPEDSVHILVTNPKNSHGPLQPTIGYRVEGTSCFADDRTFNTARIVIDATAPDYAPGEVISPDTRKPVDHRKCGIDTTEAAGWLRERLKDGPISSLFCAVEGDRHFGLPVIEGKDEGSRIRRQGRVKWWRERVLKQELRGSAKKHGFQGAWFFRLPDSTWPPRPEDIEVANQWESLFGG
jgi:hypothetical protein